MRVAILALALIGCAKQEGSASKTILPGFLDLPVIEGHYVNNSDGSIVVTSKRSYDLDAAPQNLEVLDLYQRSLIDRGWTRIRGAKEEHYVLMQHAGDADKCVTLSLVGALELRDSRPGRPAIMFGPANCASGELL